METSIPINHYLAAARDTDLKLLLRQKATAERRVERAVAAVAEAEQAIAEYIAKTYPAAPTVEA
jgi:hypothetical protein